MAGVRTAGVKPRAEMVDLPSRGGAMAILDFGPPDRPIDIVFSHGNGFNARTYASIFSPLAEELRIVSVDMRGHGRSRLPTVLEGRSDWSDHVEDLVALLQALDVGPVVLAGHSRPWATDRRSLPAIRWEAPSAPSPRRARRAACGCWRWSSRP